MTALRQRMLEDLELRNSSPATIACSLRCVADCVQHFHTPPGQLGPEIRMYQLFLVRKKHVSWSLVTQTVCALRFFYRIALGQTGMIAYIPQPKRPKALPTILRQAEVATLLQAPCRLTTRAILTTLYVAGLRVSALCHLHVTDVESARMVWRIRQGKGQQDRCVMLSPTLLPLLRQYWQPYRPSLWLFPGSAPIRRLDRRNVYAVCREAGRRAQLPQVIHPHRFRNAST
jgi:integrase/recombinase XerD